MKENKILGDLIKNNIKLIDAYVAEIEEVFQSLNLLHKKVSEKALEVLEDELFDTEEFLEYQSEAFRDELLKKEAEILLKEVVNTRKIADLIGVELSEELKEMISTKEYLVNVIEPKKVFVLNKLGKLEEREKGLYNEKLQEFITNVKKEVDAIRGNKGTN